VVLAGSYGWGTGHIPALPPRPLAPVALRPAIAYSLDWLSRAGAREIAICANQSTRQLQERLGPQYADATLAYRGDQLPRGPAGSLLDAADQLDADTLVVVEGTLIPTVSLSELLEAHRRSGATMTVVSTMRGAHAAPAGIYVLERSALAHVRATGFQDLKETLLPRLHDAGARVLPYTLSEAIPRVGNIDSYMSTNAWMVEQLATAGCAGAQGGSIVHERALLVGPVLIGAGARIAAGATIVGPSVIGEGSVVSEGALVSRSVVGRHCHIATRAVVHNSVVIEGAAVAAGVHVHRRLHVPSGGLPAVFGRFMARRRDRRAAGSSPAPHADSLPIDDTRAAALTAGTQRP
jgi:NDP-sugar pyrophosphorylase family protein